VVLKRFRFTPFQIGLHFLSLIPFVITIFEYISDASFSLNIQRIEFRTGRLALIWLILSLFCSPVYWITGFTQAFKARKTLGRYAFFYALLHALTFLILDYAFDLRLIWITLVDTLYIIIGILAFTILLLLMITSNPQSQAYLKKNWDRLHKLVYAAAVLAIIHFFLIEKSDLRWPLVASITLGFLFLVRIPYIRDRLTRKKKHRQVVITTQSRKTS